MIQSVKTLRQGSATSMKGQQRVREILKAAAAILNKGGSENFSMNKVADEVGLSLSNVQYYFPTRKDLVWALLSGMLREVDDEARQLVSSHPSSDKKRLVAFIEHSLEMNAIPMNCAVAWNAWAMSRYDKDIKEILDKWYVGYLEIITTLVTKVNPKLSKQRQAFIATFISAAIEGESIINWSVSPDPSHLRKFRKDFCKVLLQMIEDS